MNNNQIEEKTIVFMERIGYKDTQEYIDVIDIAKKLGFTLGNATFIDETDGFITIDDRKGNLLGTNSSMIIGVNSKLSIEWKRFIIAHEIAHYELHCDKSQYSLSYSHIEKSGKNKKDIEADHFAINLLMPRDKFRKKFEELENNLDYRNKISSIAKYFMVAESMAENRARELRMC
ncbi:MAG: ImmA/IrrE family metallo-endopeptidase [Lachnospiraceae bacterium]|nr:ImmA/IrrE family metallo-endopeptidase [Lachnospiraceae bacterium]